MLEDVICPAGCKLIIPLKGSQFGSEVYCSNGCLIRRWGMRVCGMCTGNKGNTCELEVKQINGNYFARNLRIIITR